METWVTFAAAAICCSWTTRVGISGLSGINSPSWRSLALDIRGLGPAGLRVRHLLLELLELGFFSGSLLPALGDLLPLRTKKQEVVADDQDYDDEADQYQGNCARCYPLRHHPRLTPGATGGTSSGSTSSRLYGRFPGKAPRGSTGRGPGRRRLIKRLYRSHRRG